MIDTHWPPAGMPKSDLVLASRLTRHHNAVQLGCPFFCGHWEQSSPQPSDPALSGFVFHPPLLLLSQLPTPAPHKKAINNNAACSKQSTIIHHNYQKSGIAQIVAALSTDFS